MIQMTCAVCKNRCALTVEENDGIITVTGNKCARGELFGKEEFRGETMLFYRALHCFESVLLVHVKTTGTVPKELVFRLIRLIKKQTIDRPMKRGEVLLHCPLGLDVDVVLDSDELEQLN